MNTIPLTYNSGFESKERSIRFGIEISEMQTENMG